MKIFAIRFLATLLFALALVAFGTTGYMVFEGWPFSDAIYMAVITLTAVGYGEVRTLTDTGRLLTMALLIGAITWMGLWFAFITSFIVELDLTNVLRRRRKMREIARMQDHYVICGAGRIGRQVAEELEQQGAPWIIIEIEPAHAKDLYDAIPDAYVIEGDATHDQLLIEAGVQRAAGLVACLPEDPDNLFVCLSARDLCPELTIVARANEEEAVHKLYRAGASHVVSPNMSGAIRMASVLLRPSVVSFVDIATRSSDVTLRVEQTTIDQASKLAGRTLAEARIPQETGLIVIALRKEGDTPRDFLFNPLADTRLQAGDEMIVLGQDEQIDRLRDYVNG